MNWLINLLKGNEIKPIFGQPFLNTSGFDDKLQGLCYKDDANITIKSVEKSVDLSVGVFENCSDSDSISTVLGISKVEFLKLIASNNSHINDILKFLYKNGDKLCLLCSIYFVTEEATLNYKSTKTGILPVSKLLLGHHIILCIPLKEQLNMNDEAKLNVLMLLTKKHDGHLPEYLMNEAAILIDYDEILRKQAFEMLDELNTWQFSDKVVSLFVEIPELRFRTNYNYFNDILAIATILKLKKFIFLNEDKFLFSSNHKCGKKPLIWNERDEVARDINSEIRQIYNMNFSTFPPPTPKILYNLCKVYEIEYYYAVNELTLLPDVQRFLYHNLETVFNFVKALPFHKLENAWIIEANDENSKEIYSIYLAQKTCILYTKNTKHLIKEFFNESIIWLLSEETKWENATEPVLIHDGKIEFLLGMITPTNCNKQACKNRKLYLARCSCNTYKDAKAWICTKCKLLVLCGDNGFAYCDCGVHREESLFKKCFKCFQKKLETQSFNILFIGQSGAGKSMLVHSIHNYLKYDFEEVLKAETVNCILPCQFQLQTPDFKKVVFRAGPEDENENFNDNGESVTPYPKVYSFKTEKYDCQVIDTPGLGDTRGAKQDEHNLNLIRNAVIEIKKLHSICFVMPSNISKLTSNFEVHMRDLLSLFPKTALKNVFFFFTYANSTFLNIGDTRNILEDFISAFKETNNAEIPFGAENVCCVDSEAFMYFIATEQGHRYPNRNLESFRISWNKSKEAVETFLVNIENVKPIKSDDLLMTYELEQIGTMLQKEKVPKLAELIEVILTVISQISMSSNFLSVKKTNTQTKGEFKKNELFQALEICQKHVVNPNLKQLIQKLIEAYGEKSFVKYAEKIGQQNGDNIKRERRIDNNKVSEIGSKYDPPRRMRSDWPCLKRLKEIADKLAKEWQNDKISRNLIEHMLNVQIARNSQEDVQKQKLKNSLEIILMEVNGKLYDMIKEFIDGNESADTNLTNDKMFAFPKRITDENSNINAVGIDLGTSRCCVAVNRKSGIETVGLENTGERLLPSYVAYDEDNTKCGQVVADRLRNYSKATVFDSKRMIGKSMVVIDKIWPFKVVNIDNQVMIKLETDRGEIQQTAIQVASELLKYMKIKTEQFQGKRLSEVVITVPAAFTTSQEEATRAAAILAGWETVTLLPEPIAASFAYFIDRPIPNNSTLILFDLGGGTLDVCVFKIINNRIQIISKNGDSRLGGRDFDNLLMDHFINKLSLDYDVNVRGNTKYKLLAECQKIKHYLSVRNDEHLAVDDFDLSKDGFIKITRQNFCDLAEDLLNKIQNTIFSALYKSQCTSNKIDKVLQVGGGCRMPMIKKLLQDIFPNAEHCCEEHPDEVVAIGAAYYAYNIFSDNKN